MRFHDRRGGLGDRTEPVFDALLNDRADDLHPADRDEATAFWQWLGEQPRPALAEGTGGRRLLSPRGWGMAAGLVLTIATIGAAWLGEMRGRSAPLIAHYEAGPAQRRVLHLADGSTVTLAARTSIDLRFTRGQRHLTLRRGEAMFEVAHDTTRPFVVETVHGEVTAVGTAFDVVVGRQDAEVTVVEGTIRIALPDHAAPDREPILKLATRGEQLAFGTVDHAGTKMGFIRQSPSVDVEAATAWKDGQFIFHGEPLAKVVETVNRYVATPGERLVLTDARAGTTPVFGIVHQGDLDAIRDLIADSGTVQVEQRPASAHRP